MSNTLMTGRREERDGRTLLVIEREFRAPLDDVWAACTEPSRMERWIGTWSGDPADGSVSFRMTAEGDDVPAEEMDVLACEPPHRFAVRSREPQPFSEDGQGEKALWEMELELREADGVTSLRFVQVLVPGATGVEHGRERGSGLGLLPRPAGGRPGGPGRGRHRLGGLRGRVAPLPPALRLTHRSSALRLGRDAPAREHGAHAITPSRGRRSARGGELGMLRARR